MFDTYWSHDEPTTRGKDLKLGSFLRKAAELFLPRIPAEFRLHCIMHCAEQIIHRLCTLTGSWCSGARIAHRWVFWLTIVHPTWGLFRSRNQPYPRSFRGYDGLTCLWYQFLDIFWVRQLLAMRP